MLLVRIALGIALFAGLPAAAVDVNPPSLDPKYGEGCWVRFFEEPGFKRPLGSLAGALYINSISEPGLIGSMSEAEFFRRARSAIIGPEAHFTAYAERGFAKEIFSLESGRKVEDLQALGFPKAVASVKINCRHR